MINESVKSVFSGLSLSTTPPQIYAAMAMAAVFGSKRILDTLVTRGLQIDSIITGGGRVACEVDKRRLVGLRLIFHAVAVDEHAVLLVNGQLVLVIALPLQLAHELHHAKLDVGVNRHIPELDADGRDDLRCVRAAHHLDLHDLPDAPHA